MDSICSIQHSQCAIQRLVTQGLALALNGKINSMSAKLGRGMWVKATQEVYNIPQRIGLNKEQYASALEGFHGIATQKIAKQFLKPLY